MVFQGASSKVCNHSQLLPHVEYGYNSNFMFAYCILHNMIVEDESDVLGLENILVGLEDFGTPLRRGLSFEDLATSTRELENENKHYELQGNLIEFLWDLKGNNQR